MLRNYFMAYSLDFSSVRYYRIMSYNSPWFFMYIKGTGSFSTTETFTISDGTFNNFLPYAAQCVHTIQGELVKTNTFGIAPDGDKNIVGVSYVGNTPHLIVAPKGHNFDLGRLVSALSTGDSIAYNAFCILLEMNDTDYYAITNIRGGYPPKTTPNLFCYSTISKYPTKTSLGSVESYYGQGSETIIFSKNSITRANEFAAWLLKNIEPYNPDDPYPNAGDDPDDSPEGDFDYTPDPIDIPDLPTTSVTDSGLVSLYAPTEAQLKALASFLWSDAFSLDTFKKMFNNPMDCILGLTILPINVPHGSAREITVGNIVSTVSCDTLPTQYIALDCGTFKFKQSAFTGSYLDFSPYTKCYVYLPFIGCQEIDIDEFMGTTMGVVYHIDILTGALFCYVTRNGSVIYTYAGCCAENVPLSSNDFSTTVGSIMQIGIAAAGAVATIASAGAATPATAAAATALQAKTAAGVTAAGITGASAVMNSKPSVAHSGSLGGGGGMMGVMYPYLIFIAPRASIPSDQNNYTGFPANKIVKISSLSGFNVIEAVNLEVKGANDSEMSEIDQYLKAGVII